MIQRESREVPYVLRGRDAEFAAIADRMFRLPREVSVITGPPGTGKTALLTSLVAYAVSHGFAVAELDASDFHDVERFDRAIRGAASGKEAESRREVDGKTWNANANLSTTGGGIGGGRSKNMGEARPRLLVDILREAVAIGRKRCGGKKKCRGLIIALDEAQHLCRAETTAEQWRTAKDIIKYLNDFTKRISTRQPVMLICAGINPTGELIREAISYRPADGYIHRLRQISDSAVRQILRDHLRVTDQHRRKPATVADRQIQLLVRSCEGSVHHASATGYHLQQLAFIAREQGDEAMTDEDVSSVIELVDTDKQDLYSNPWELCRNVGQEVLKVLAMAARPRHNRLPVKKTQMLVSLILKRIGTNEEASTVIRRLANLGALQLWETANKHASREYSKADQSYYEIPIPSMLTWLEDKRRDEELSSEDEWRQLIDKTLGPPEENQVAEWSWKEARAMVQIKPVLSYGKTAASNKLLQPIAGD